MRQPKEFVLLNRAPTSKIRVLAQISPHVVANIMSQCGELLKSRSIQFFPLHGGASPTLWPSNSQNIKSKIIPWRIRCYKVAFR